MELSFGKSELIADEIYHRTFPKQEWLLTNGIGGFASSTIIGLNTRRYHGLLVASLNPPVDRRLLVAKLDEDLYIDHQPYVLGTNQVRDGYAGGYLYLQRFERYPFPYISSDGRVFDQNHSYGLWEKYLVHYKVINPFQNISFIYFLFSTAEIFTILPGKTNGPSQS